MEERGFSIWEKIGCCNGGRLVDTRKAGVNGVGGCDGGGRQDSDG
jgi:hypothetical protein